MIIVRSVGERTTDECMRRLPGAVLIEGVYPFTETLRQCYEMALDSGDEYLLCVDADVLPEAGLVRSVERKIRPGHTMTYRCIDKFTDRARTVGISAYHRDTLTTALAHIDSSNIKPERHARGAAGKRIKVPGEYGRHGYEQYYRDIYRSARVWSQKHKWSHRVESWRDHKDADFRVAYEGWRHGRQYGAIVDGSTEGFDASMERLGLTEKGPYGTR